MTEGKSDIFEDDPTFDSNVPRPFIAVQKLLDRFVEINYDAALDAVRLHSKDIEVGHIRQQIVDIIRNNPPLKSVPLYYKDGRVNYLWYSDFYEDSTKDVFVKHGRFAPMATEITSANYTAELAKIELPYFRALVDLIGLVKLEQEAERRNVVAVTAPEPAETTESENVEPESSELVEEVASVNEPEQPEQPEPAPEPEPKPLAPEEQPIPKRSYEPKLTNEQYSLLAKCVERIKLFRRPASATQLRKLFAGKLAEPLQVMNQLPMVYLLDQLRDAKLIKRAWMTVAFENRDFISFRTEGLERRYGPGPHYLTMAQMKSRRHDSKHVYIDGGDDIEDTVEQMLECRDK